MQPALLSSRKGSAKIGPKPSACGEFLISGGLCHCVARHTRMKRKAWPCSGCHDMTNKHCLRLQTLTLNLWLLKKDAKIQMWSSRYPYVLLLLPRFGGGQKPADETCGELHLIHGFVWEDMEPQQGKEHLT